MPLPKHLFPFLFESLEGDRLITPEEIARITNPAASLVNTVELTGNYTAVEADFTGYTHTIFWSRQNAQLDLIMPADIVPDYNILVFKQLTTNADNGRILLQAGGGGKFDKETDHLISDEEALICQHMGSNQFIIVGDYIFSDANTNNFLNGATFNNETRDLTLTRQGLSTITVNIPGGMSEFAYSGETPTANEILTGTGEDDTAKGSNIELNSEGMIPFAYIGNSDVELTGPGGVLTISPANLSTYMDRTIFISHTSTFTINLADLDEFYAATLPRFFLRFVLMTDILCVVQSNSSDTIGGIITRTLGQNDAFTIELPTSGNTWPIISSSDARRAFDEEITQDGNVFNLSENVRVDAINIRDDIQTGTHADVNVTFVDTSGLSDTVSATVMIATNLKTGRLLVKLTPQLASQSGFVPNITAVTAVLTNGVNIIALGNVPFDITAGYQELIFNPVVEVEGNYDLVFTFTFINGGEDIYKITGINYEFHQVGNLYNPVIELIDESIPEPSPPTPRGLLFDSTDQKTRVISTVNLLKGATHESTETIDFAFFDNSFNIIGNVITATETPTTIASGSVAIGIKASDGNGHEVTFNNKTFETIASTTVNGVGYFLAALDGIETIIDPTPRINLNVQSLQVLEDVEGLMQDVSNNTLELIELKTQANASTEITELITRNEDDVTVYTYTGDIFSVDENPIQIISGTEYANGARDNVNNILFGTISSGGNETVLSLGAVELVRTVDQNVQASVFVPSVPERQEISTQYVLESNGSGGQNNPVDVIPGYRTASGSIKPRDIAYSYTENIPTSGNVTFEIDIVLNGNSDGVRRITLPFGGDVNETLVTDDGLNTNVNFRFFYTSSNTVINVEVVDSSSNVAVELGNYYVRGTWQQTITIPEIPATRDWISIGRLANSQADFAFGFIVQDSNLSLVYNINGMTGLFPTETAIPTGIDVKNDLTLIHGWIQKITFTSGTSEEQRQRFIQIISNAIANVSDAWLGFRTATNLHEVKLISDAQMFSEDQLGNSRSVLDFVDVVGSKVVKANIISDGIGGYEISFTELN